jgi:hypothetical protein
MNRAEIAFPALVLVAVAALLAAGFLVLEYSWTVIAFPFGAGIVLSVLCLLQLATSVWGRPPMPGTDEQPDKPVTASSVAWILALAVCIYGLGFVLGPAIFLLVYFRVRGFSWHVSSAVAAGSLSITWGLFIKVLRVLLPVEPPWLS